MSEIITPIINDQTIEIIHPQHGEAHIDRSTLSEWTVLGWQPKIAPKPVKPAVGKKSAKEDDGKDQDPPAIV